MDTIRSTGLNRVQTLADRAIDTAQAVIGSFAPNVAYATV